MPPRYRGPPDCRTPPEPPIDRPIISRDELLGGLPASRAPTLLRLLAHATDAIGSVLDPADLGTTLLHEAHAVLRVETAAVLPADATVGAARLGQTGLLPHALPRPVGWEIATAYEPAREVGGDFYDAFAIRGRRGMIGFLIADVTGKGIPAALMMAFTRPLLRSAAEGAPGPAEALARANRILVEERPASQLVTAFHAFLDPRTGTLTWANAGHEPPLLVPSVQGRVRRLAGRGMLLGVSASVGYSESRTRMGQGDLVLAYTDGVTDARRADGMRFGEARLLRAVHRLRGRSARETADGVLEAVHRFVGGAAAADDVALLCLRRAESGT